MDTPASLPLSRGHSARRKVLLAAAPVSGDCLREIARYAREHRWHLVTDMLVTGAFPRGWEGDGILAVVSFQPEVIQCIQASATPCVAIALSDEPAHLPRVAVDNGEIGRIAADHFLERGYRHFAWAPFANDHLNGERFIGFQTRLQHYGCDCWRLPPRQVRIGPYWQHDWRGRRRELVAQLARLPKPAAVFAFNDCVAAEIIDAAPEAGAAVPEDIAVLGVGNDSVVCESAPVPLSSIDLDFRGLVHRAATMLDLMMSGEGSPSAVVRLPPAGVIARVSTDIIAVAHPRIASALKHIAENYHNPMLSVTDVADAVGMSRRQLERTFREETGATINEHIVRARMQEASRLLKAHPRAKAADIAALVGISGTGTFHRTFRRYFGMSPSDHRYWSGQATPRPEAPPVPSLSPPTAAQVSDERMRVRPAGGGPGQARDRLPSTTDLCLAAAPS